MSFVTLTGFPEALCQLGPQDPSCLDRRCFASLRFTCRSGDRRRRFPEFVLRGCRFQCSNAVVSLKEVLESSYPGRSVYCLFMLQRESIGISLVFGGIDIS